jgi:hypothetical protein
MESADPATFPHIPHELDAVLCGVSTTKQMLCGISTSAVLCGISTTKQHQRGIGAQASRDPCNSDSVTVEWFTTCLNDAILLVLLDGADTTASTCCATY